MTSIDFSKGIMMFAHNNEEIDYFKLAVVNALLIQKNLGLSKYQITVITDPDSIEYGRTTLGDEIIDRAIGLITVIEKDYSFKRQNHRIFKDTSHRSATLPFYNKDRSDAYDLSPYNETIVIDADYLILSDRLNSCWGHNNDLMMNHDYYDVMTERKFTGLEFLNTVGIPMYWATVVYFRKSDYCNTFFEVVKHVLGHRDYYKNLYAWKGNTYRNDYSFSIAAHVVGGFKSKGIPQLPFKTFKTFDTDDIHDVDDDFSIIFYLEKPKSPGDFILTRWKGVDVHIMNKWALNRISDKVLKALDNDIINSVLGKTA